MPVSKRDGDSRVPLCSLPVSGSGQGGPMDCVDYAILAEDVYRPSLTELAAEAGWQRIWSTAERATGFFCALYHSRAAQTHVVAYRGTETAQWGDLLTNAGIALRRLTPQFVLALGAIEAASHRADGRQQIAGVCGHSLGGALAAYVGARRGMLAYAFNAPGIVGIGGVSRETDRGDIRNVIAAGDLIGKWGRHLGRTVTVPVSSIRFVPGALQQAVAATGGLAGIGAYLLSQHSMTNLRRKLAALPAHQRPFA